MTGPRVQIDQSRESLQHRVSEKKELHRERTPGDFRGYPFVHVWEETTHGQGKTNQKEKRAKCLALSQGQEQCLPPPGKPKDPQDTRQNTQKGLASIVGNNYPILLWSFSANFFF